MLPNIPAHGQAVRIDTAAARVFRMKKGVMTAARLVNDRLKSAPIRWVPVMVTLTYRPDVDWQPKHIAEFCNRVQMYAKRRGYKFPCVWVMELHKSGIPHYHVLFWVPARLRLPKADRQGWWPHGMTNIIRVKNAVGYVAKYASKFESKDAEFPHGARIHGIGGITGIEKRIIAWWKLPKSLRTGEEGSVVWRRAVGGGWLNPETGERQVSEWGMSAASSGQVLLVKKLDGSHAYQHGDQWQQIVERVADLRWREDLTRSERLAEWSKTDRYAYWTAFEAMAQQIHEVAAIPNTPIQPVQQVASLRGPLPLSMWREARAEFLRSTIH